MSSGNLTTWQQLIPFSLQRFSGWTSWPPLPGGGLPGLRLVLSDGECVSVSTLVG